MKTITCMALCIYIFPLASLAETEDFLSADEWKKTFCDKTTKGINHGTSWTFKTYINENCNEISVKYLKGYDFGRSFEEPLTLPLTVHQNGEICVKGFDDKKTCWKVRAVDEGVYRRVDMDSGAFFITDKNPEDGKQF